MNVRSGGANRWAAGSLLLLIPLVFLTVAPAAHAVDVPTLYSAEVPLDPEQGDPRAAAYRAALGQVLLRVSGPELVADAEAVNLLFPEPAAYVVQFRRGAEETLWVSFDGDAIERTLRQAGETVWGADRPLTLVWLAVDWGLGEREIIGADDAERTIDEARSIDRNRLLRQRVLDVAERRGIPVLFPLLDIDDLQKVSFTDIWGGFDEQLLEASRRYDVSSVLVGRIRPDTAQRNRWTWYFADQQSAWNGEPELVMNLVADSLAAEFAVSGSAPVEALELRIAGVGSVEDYGSVHRLLTGLSVVDSFSIITVTGDEIRYRVESQVGSERLRRALRFAGLIEVEGYSDGGFAFDEPETLNFFYGQGQPER